MERETSKIIAFKPRASIRATTRSEANDGLPSSFYATVDFGAGWYHENAMREATPRDRTSVVRLRRP
jgi:hypothetical protein